MPKYGLIIQDLSEDQVKTIISKMNIPDFLVKDSPAAAPAAPSAPVPAAPVAPAAPAAPSAPVSDNAERDVDGLPWLEELHAGTKSKNADGRWKLKKGVDKKRVEQIRAQYNPAPAAPVAPAAPAAPSAPVPAAPPAPPAPPPAPAPVAPAAPAPVAAPAKPARNFEGLMQRISALFASKEIQPDYPQTIVDRINQGFGSKVRTLTDITDDERMTEYAWQCLDVDGKGV